MGLPLPRVIPDVGPGGPLVTAMGGINALANNMHLSEINRVKAKYAPISTLAQAASQSAYANLMGPQYIAKMLQNDGILGNLPEETKRQLLQMSTNAGMGQGGASNALNQMINQASQESMGGGNSLSNFFANHLKNIFGGNPQQQMPQQQANPMNIMPGMGAPAQNQPNNQQPGMSQGQSSAIKRPSNGVMLEGEQWYDKNGVPVYADDAGESGRNPMQMTLTSGQAPVSQPTWAENTGSFKGDVNQGAESGKFRAKDVNDIGQQQLQLSNTGANLDRIIEDINDPNFMDLRKDFPFYQDMQLHALTKIGTPEQQEMIGKFISDVKSFAGATVNSFRGNSMKREFDYADQLKPNENDTVNTARGKLTALKALKEIASQKNDIILDLMQNKHMNLGDAVKIANKKVDVKAIDQQVSKLTSPMITLHDPKNPSITIRLPLLEAKQRGYKNG